LALLRPHGARNIHHNDGACGIRGGFPVALLLDARERAEKELADIGEDGGAPRRDAVLGQEQIELAKGMMDARGGAEVIGMAGERGGEY